MRKASQDGGDSTSITSGIESETKKPGAGILKSTKNSIKRKVQHFSDDTANEPLLHKSKEISEIEKQSAKLLLSKTKTDFGCQKGDDKDKLLADDKIAMPSISDVTGLTNCGITVALNKAELKSPSSQSTSTASIHNHMNTNVFSNIEGTKKSGVTKTQILVELDTSKPSGYSPSPLIFTTAKIHTDGKMQQMEPVQVTPVPILSTIEGGVVKTETKLKESSEKQTNGEFLGINNKNIIEQCSKDKKNITMTPLMTQVASLSKLPEKREHDTKSTQNIIVSASNKSAQSASNVISDNKAKNSSTLKHAGSGVGNITSGSSVGNITLAKLPDISKKTKDETFTTKIPQLSQENNDKIGSKLSSNTIQSESTFPKNIQILNKTDIAHKISSSSSTADKSYVDINKNVQSNSETDAGERKPGNSTEDLKVVTSKPINDVKTKEELDKINPSLISTVKTGQEDQKSSDFKSQSKEEVRYNVKSLNNEKSVITTTATAINIGTVNETREIDLSKATSPSTSSYSTKKAMDKTPLTFSKTISTETSPLIKPSAKIATISDQTNPNQTDSSKTTSSGSISNVNTSTTEGRTTSNEIRGSNLGSANNQSARASTASKSKITGKSNSATVVSSISKPVTTVSGMKLPSSSTSSTGVVTSVPKQSVSVKMVPSGIPIISSSVKPSTANAATSKNVSVTSGPVNKSVSNNTKPTDLTAKVSATDSSSIASPVLSLTAKPSSTKPAAQNVSQTQDKPSEAVKDVKGSKA